MLDGPQLGTTSYYYDDNGNLSQILPPGVDPNEAGDQRYYYNQRNLLITSTVRGDSSWDDQATFTYDGMGNRVQQVDLTGSTPITTTYANDNLGLSQVLVAYSGNEEASNLFGLDLILQDTRAAILTLLTDGLGSVRLEMVEDTIKTATTYDPYGNQLVQTGTNNTAYGFTGEQKDSSTGLLYLRARYYRPDMYVFMSRDPYKGQPRIPSTIHGYSYVENDPINFVDPSGLYKKDVHYDLTYQIALKVLGSKCGGRGSRACAQHLWIAEEIAWANQHMDSFGLMAKSPGWRITQLHFEEMSTILDNLRRSIEERNPAFFGAALHQYQDFFSHVGSGYGANEGHADDEWLARCRRGQEYLCPRTDSQELTNEFYGRNGVSTDFTVGSITDVLNDLEHLGVDFRIVGHLGQTSIIITLEDGRAMNLSESELIDVWLRENTTARSAHRTHYGYFTDGYYPFTRRDQAMTRGTQRWIERFFSNQVYTYPDEYYSSCPISPIEVGYTRPSDTEIKRFLRSEQNGFSLNEQLWLSTTAVFCRP